MFVILITKSDKVNQNFILFFIFFTWQSILRITLNLIFFCKTIKMVIKIIYLKKID